MEAASTPSSGGASWIPADPGPLGLAGFAMTTFVLSMYNANLVSPAGSPVVLGLALAYGGIAQLLAGMWEFRTGNTFGAVAFTSLRRVLALLLGDHRVLRQDAPGWARGQGHRRCTDCAWAIFTAYMWVASFRTTAAVNLVFFLLTITFILLAIGNAGPHIDGDARGGYLGLATAVGRVVRVLRGRHQRDVRAHVLPVKPLSRA